MVDATTLKIVITGASGFLGKQIVPLFRRRGVVLLLVGRNAEQLSKVFPDYNCCDYTNMALRAKGFDMLLHLAVRNNNIPGSVDEFRAVNVDLLLATVEMAREAGIGSFVNVSSIQALDDRNTSPYAVSKREGAVALRGQHGIDILTVYLPLLYSTRWNGKLAFLNRIPTPVANIVFTFIAALKPTLHAERFVNFVLSPPVTARAMPLILSDGQHLNPVYRITKRMLDLGFALSVFLLFWYGLIAIWVLIRIGSPGPGIFAQTRVGRNGTQFVCYKFRTMKVDTKQAGTHEVSASSLTGIGRLLRKTKLDELPQIWNIFRNEMSLVGPRPCLPFQTELVAARLERGILALKPGISGLAQVNNVDMSNPTRLANWDARYLALQCLLVDLRIAFATATGEGAGDNVA